jgi:putative MATE family efflux protein
MEPILVAFGASENVLPYARDYLGILLFGSFFGCVAVFNPIMRSEGYPMKAMVTMLISTGVNLALSPTFIFVFHMGIKGAALATFFGQIATATWVFLFLIKKERVVRLCWKHYRLNFPNLWRITQLGLSTFLMQFIQSMLSMVMNKSLGFYGGDIAISSWGITTSIMNLISQPVFGLNQGAQPIVGYNIGAKNYGRVKSALAWALAMASCFSILGWTLTRLLPNQLFAFFNDDPELIRVGSHMIIVFMMFLFVTGFQQAGAAYYQFVGKPTAAVLLTLLRQGFILIPCLLILPRFFQLEGIRYSGPIADLGSALITGVCVLAEIRRLNRLELQERSLREIAAAQQS